MGLDRRNVCLMAQMIMKSAVLVWRRYLKCSQRDMIFSTGQHHFMEDTSYFLNRHAHTVGRIDTITIVVNSNIVILCN